jgi:hypothetical protein
MAGRRDEGAVNCFRSAVGMCCAAFAALLCGACEERTQAAVTSTCAVYRALYEDATAQDGESIVYFRHQSRHLYPREVRGPFERETGASETVRVGNETYDFPILEPFEANVSDLTRQLTAAKRVSIRSCFSGADAPRFSILPLWTLNIIHGQRPDELVGNVVIHSFSPAVISSDGQRALVYAEYYCGGLCAAGTFHFLERRNSVWEITGHSMVWIS